MMSEFRIDNLPNDDSFHPGENMLYSNEQLAPAYTLLSELAEKPEEEVQQFISDFRDQTHRGDKTMSAARWNAANREIATRTPKEDFTPYALSPKLARYWAGLVTSATYAERIVCIDQDAGEEHEHITKTLLFDETNTAYVGQKMAENAQDLPAFRERVAQLGGAEAVAASLQKLQLELQAQFDWAFVVQGVNLHGGFGLSIASFSSMRKHYVELAESTIQTLHLTSAEDRLAKISAMKKHIAGNFVGENHAWDRKDPLFYYFSACETAAKNEASLYESHARVLVNLREYVPRRIAEETDQKRELQRANHAAEIQAEYKEHIETSVALLSGKARKREGYEGMWNTLIGRAQDKAVTPMLDQEANRILSTLHALRTMVEPSFEGVRDAQEWQQETRAYEQALADRYTALGYPKEFSLKDGVGARLDWLSNNWDFVAGQVRAVPGFPVQRVAAALFPEVAQAIQEQEQTAERQQSTVAHRLGATSLEQLVVQEVDWEILPVENIAASIQQEAERMTHGRQRSETGRRTLQEVRVRDLVELSTLFDDAVVHVSREKDGITRRKNEPYFVITFTYGDKRFALAENLVLDNATFLLPEGEFDWKDVFSLPRGAVGEFGAKRINHPSVDETGEYEGGPNAHVNAIFKKLDSSLIDI